MLPTEQFSGDATKGPPWTPQVWRDGPDVLVAQAQQALWADQHDIVADVLDGDNRAMSGSETAPENESDITYATQMAAGDRIHSSEDVTNRADVWDSTMDDMRATEPRIAGWSSGDHVGPPNPAP
jgi:hypothetical protein